MSRNDRCASALRRCVASVALGMLASGSAAAQAAPEAAAATQEANDLRAELERERARVRELEERVAELLLELESSRSERMARELQWLEFNRFIQSLELAPRLEPGEDLEFDVRLPLVETDVLPAAPADVEREAQARSRAVEMRTTLRTLLRMEQVFGLDLLEAGTLGPVRFSSGSGEPADPQADPAEPASSGAAETAQRSLGPVIFRQLNDRGQLIGSLSAQRLWLDSSQAAHTVTLVLEDGFESQAGVRTPFRNGVRRIALPHVDPAPWIEALPELFPARDVAARRESVARNYEGLRAELNELLAEDAGSVRYQVRHLGGASPEGLRAVHLIAFDASGRLERRIFADRLEIRPQSKGVQLVLHDGAVLRGNEKTAFREGRFRIFLTRADSEAWRQLLTKLGADVPEAVGPSPDAADR